MRTPFLYAALCLSLSLLPGCGDDAAAPMLTPGALKVQAEEWNGKQVPVGQVAAVVDTGTDVVVFSSLGAMLFTSGLLLSTDPAVQKWQAAALIPAGDLSGHWVAGADATGHVYRLRNRSVAEDVTDRYGLLGAPVRDLADLGGGMTGFVLDQKLAVADGKVVTRYDGDWRGLGGGGGRAAAVGPDVVRLLDLHSGQVQLFAVPAAVAVAFDAGGKLVVAARDSLYQEGDGGVLHRVYQSPDANIAGLAPSGMGIWVAMGSSVALLSGEKLLQAPAGSLPAGARLRGASGDGVWLLGNGKLSRLSQSGSGGPDEQLWKTTVYPVFSRVCSLCHLPGGVAGIDLSSYPAWSLRRALVGKRVIDGKPTPMPPAGAGTLRTEELDAIRNWVMNSPR